MSRAENKASRLMEIEALLLAHPEGLTQVELSRRLGVNRSTIHRYLPDLTAHFPIYEDDDGRIFLDRQAYLVNVRFSLHEALALHLAARLLVTRLDRQNPHAAAALRKLGLALEGLAPFISHHMLQSADLMDTQAMSFDPQFLGVLENLTLAWAEGRKARIWHRTSKQEPVYSYLFSPYFIEPYAVGQSIHTIGLRQPPGKIRTFKVERIERVELLRERYSIPQGFDPRQLLSEAWGIWYTESEPVEVVLMFSSRVASRVQENRWHTSQRLEEQPDGRLLLRASVAEPQEMLPWIRGWGADVEVVAPDRLRYLLVEESIRLANIYSAKIHATPKEWLMWAKTDRNNYRVHSLPYHLIDVGQVALQLWDLAFPAQTRRVFSGWLGLDEASTGRLLAYWISLHDLGKAAPGFQRKYPPAVARLEAAGFTFPRPSVQPAMHGAVTCWALKSLLTELSGLDRQEALEIARSVGGHHGTWPTAVELAPTAIGLADLGDETWSEARSSLAQSLREIFQPPTGVHLPHDQVVRNSLLTLLSGLTSAADWIGSMDVYFPYFDAGLPLEQYSSQAAQQANSALHSLGWVGWQPQGERLTFNELFPGMMPNPVQQAVINEASELSSPTLVILEAPTGCGKTEAALYMADSWLQKHFGRGFYVAMPTQATSNQMYDRVTKFLQKRYRDQDLNVHLVHGAAILSAPAASPAEVAEEGPSPHEGNIRAAGWFLPRKRTLLAPFGIGTVDQSLMSVLQTRHFFVRLFGLGQKVVVFDEVHAYDTYMSVLFQRLLQWLQAIGTSVIMLTATLPEVTRRELAAAWSGKKQVDLPVVEYPRLTILTDEQASVHPLAAGSTKVIEMERTPSTPEAIAAVLSHYLDDGGCAAVICNRVKRAQELYRVLREASIVEPENLFLFHARFPLAWREEIEKSVLDRFSFRGKRPKKAIVVATQVIEQSLDLDFDLMVSDTAPIDLLLQRAGRLHRHGQNDADRPAVLQHPRLVLADPAYKDGVPDFEGDEFVYDRAILLKTWLGLRQRDRITLPEETTQLIEAVYSPQATFDGLEPELTQEIKAAVQKMESRRQAEIMQAKSRLIARPDDEGLLGEANQNLEEENPEIHNALRALTRLSDPGIPLVCLHSTHIGLAFEPDGSGAPLDLEGMLSTDTIHGMLRCSVNIQQWEVVKHYLGQKRPQVWERVPALRYHYLAVFDEQGLCRLEGTPITLKLSRETGLEVTKEVL